MIVLARPQDPPGRARNAKSIIGVSAWRQEMDATTTPNRAEAAVSSAPETRTRPSIGKPNDRRKEPEMSKKGGNKAKPGPKPQMENKGPKKK